MMEAKITFTKKFIETKLEQGIRPSIRDLERRLRITKEPENPIDRDNPHTMLKFQRAREEWFLWAERSPVQNVLQRIKDLEATLSADELDCKYGNVSFLPVETFQTIAFIEDMEIAIGLHPSLAMHIEEINRSERQTAAERAIAEETQNNEHRLMQKQLEKELREAERQRDQDPE